MDTDMEETRSPESTTNLQHGAKKKHNVVVFPHFRDRLACDPLNFFCVYATYEYKLKDSAAEAERNIFSLVDAMVDSVRKAFDEALQHWKQMPAFLRQAHTFRAVMAIPSAPLTSTLMHLFSRKESSVRYSLTRKSADCNTSSLFGGTQTDGMASASDTVAGRNNCSTATTPRSAHRERRGEEEEEAIMKRLMQQWLPPNNYPKCRIVLDIIASRKTLGGDPPNSKPYRLGVKVFSYVKRKYPEEVITTFVGISDSSVMLVGRNILYPYRVTGGGGLKVNTTLPSPGGTRHILAGASGLSLLSFGATDAITTSGTGGVSAMVSNLEQMLLNSIPAPRVVTAPPTNTDKVDNLRLVVCFQPTDVVDDAE